MIPEKKELRVASQEEVQQMENEWSKIFNFYLSYNESKPLTGKKLGGSIARTILYDFAVGRCLAQRPHAIYNFSQEFINLEDKFSTMVMNHFDNLSEEDKNVIMSS